MVFEFSFKEWIWEKKDTVWRTIRLKERVVGYHCQVEILELRRWKQGDHELEGQPGLHGGTLSQMPIAAENLPSMYKIEFHSLYPPKRHRFEASIRRLCIWLDRAGSHEVPRILRLFAHGLPSSKGAFLQTMCSRNLICPTPCPALS